MTEPLEQRVREALDGCLIVDQTKWQLHGESYDRLIAILREVWTERDTLKARAAELELERQSRIAIVFDLRQAVDRLTIENYRLAKERDALQVEMHKPRWRLI